MFFYFSVIAFLRAVVIQVAGLPLAAQPMPATITYRSALATADWSGAKSSGVSRIDAMKPAAMRQVSGEKSR